MKTKTNRNLWLAALIAVALSPAAITLAQDPSTPQTAAPQQLPTFQVGQSCPHTLLQEYDPNKGEFFGHDTPIWTNDDGTVVMFQSGMTIDADGAPNAYNADNTGLDDIANAGSPGHWDGIIVDREGNPLVQSADDPFPGFYISCTALVDWNKPRTDPTRYVDASKIPYIVLPGGLSREMGARLGDFAVVTNLRRGTRAYAIFADVGTLGEGSVALADQLGIWSDAREGGTRGGVQYVIYPGSGNRQPRSLEEINSETDRLFQDYGGAEKISTCAMNQQPHTAVDQVADKNFH